MVREPENADKQQFFLFFPHNISLSLKEKFYCFWQILFTISKFLHFDKSKFFVW